MAYQGRQPGVGVRNRFIYSATGGQTSFSGADSNGLTLAYADATYVDVFLNGTLLVPVTDYAATTKTSVVFGSGAAASDIVEIVAYDISSIANAVPTSGGTFTGAVTVQGNFSADGGTIKLDGNYPVGTSNVALGDTALDDGSLSGGYNTAVGSAVLSDATSGNSNTAMGYQSLRYATTAAGNVSIGVNAMRDTTSGGSNIAVGQDALRSNTTASNNTAVGYQAGFSNTTASFNTFIGRLSGYTNTTGSQNTSVGVNSFRLNTTGQYNTVIGKSALEANTTGNYNVALGHTALASNTTANNNTAVGYRASHDNTTGTRNVSMGKDAMYQTTTGSDQVGIGYEALTRNTTGGNNVAIGKETLSRNTTGNHNVAVGYDAGYSNTTGNNNTVIGRDAGYSNQTSGGNVFIGEYAGRSTTNSDNTFLGTSSGWQVTSGSKNTILGRYNGNQGGLDIRTSSNNIVLSDGDGNPQLHINSAGWHTQYGPLYSYSSNASQSNITIRNNGSGADGTDYLQCRNSGNGANLVIEPDGDVKNTNNTYGAISDAKLKENILDATSQWDDLKAIQVRKYNLIGSSNTHLGVVAQELEAAGMSGLVSDRADKDDDGNDLGTVTKNVKYSILYMKAVKALQEAMARIETLETKVTALEG